MGMKADPDHPHSSSRLIGALPERLYEAFVDPDRLVHWLPPQGATAVIEEFDPKIGGRFKIVLSFVRNTGKSSAKNDVVLGRFLSLVPGREITQAIEFVSDRPEFKGTMTMDWSFQRSDDKTLVSVVAKNVPEGIDRADHERGMASSLENLAAFVEQHRCQIGRPDVG
jgi:uncharacterized protein YndB with AHSA1/START domain